MGHSIYQSDSQLVIEVKPIKEDPNKVNRGVPKDTRASVLAHELQDIDVRAVLQILAEQGGVVSLQRFCSRQHYLAFN